MSQGEIRTSFSDGWQVDSIDAAKMDVTFEAQGVFAWLATITPT